MSVMPVVNNINVNFEYDEIKAGHSMTIRGEQVVFIDRKNGKNKLLVSVATLMNKGVFAGLTSYYRYFPGDVLFISDIGNTYYLRNDRGNHIKSMLSEVVKDYDPANIVFCGASMAGFASIDMALHFNANAVVNNPQVNLSVTIDTAWLALKEFIAKIPMRYNLDDVTYTSRESVIGAIIGQHPMDKVNRDALFDICSRTPGMSLIYGSSYDYNHKYYYQGITGFMKMFDAVINHRLLMSQIHDKFPLTSA